MRFVLSWDSIKQEIKRSNAKDEHPNWHCPLYLGFCNIKHSTFQFCTCDSLFSLKFSSYYFVWTHWNCKIHCKFHLDCSASMQVCTCGLFPLWLVWYTYLVFLPVASYTHDSLKPASTYTLVLSPKSFSTSSLSVIIIARLEESSVAVSTQSALMQRGWLCGINSHCRIKSESD